MNELATAIGVYATLLGDRLAACRDMDSALILQAEHTMLGCLHETAEALDRMASDLQEAMRDIATMKLGLSATVPSVVQSIAPNGDGTPMDLTGL